MSRSLHRVAVVNTVSVLASVLVRAMVDEIVDDVRKKREEVVFRAGASLSGEAFADGFGFAFLFPIVFVPEAFFFLLNAF